MTTPTPATPHRPDYVGDELLWDVAHALEQHHQARFTSDGQLVCGCDEPFPCPSARLAARGLLAAGSPPEERGVTAIQPGDVLHVNQPDYLYGSGPLRLRVTKIGRLQQLAGNDWLDLEGLTLRPDGTPLSSSPRHVVVRVSALRHGIQRPERQS